MGIEILYKTSFQEIEALRLEDVIVNREYKYVISKTVTIIIIVLVLISIKEIRISSLFCLLIFEENILQRRECDTCNAKAIGSY
mmetsp:Transcript_20335/g.28230  ORF Transcript_20335/g.28230 Transcript_20335/m.28230 type:complete len:84 (-) Transcript_20335:1354-1605(-)